MKLAIIFGVSEYQNYTSLAACKNDAELVEKIFLKLGKFDDLCVLAGNIKGFEAKQKLTEFVNKHKDTSVDELVFYYTGHGARYDDDFFYIFSDFNEKRKEVTALRNSELDGLIRNLSPGLTVKVIDACYSGSTYIKSDDDIKPTLEKSAKENSLSNLYFLHSSSSEETSLANDLYSFFTYSFCKSVTDLDGAIRYRDIMAYVADDMSQKGYPKPTFIVQADNTEVFGEIDDDFKKYVKECLNIQDDDIDEKDDNKDEKSETKKEDDFIKEIQRKSKEEFCSKGEALKNISLIKGLLEQSNWPEQILKVFDIEVDSIEDTYSIKNKAEIGRWLNQQSKEIYFAGPTFDSETFYEEEYKKLPKKPSRATDMLGGLYSIRRSLGLDDEHEYKLEKVEKTRRFIDGFEYTADSPYRGLQLLFKPKYQSVENYALTIVLIFSRKDLVFFVAREVLPYQSWDNIESPKCRNWKTKTVLLKNESEIRCYINELISSMSVFISEDIKKKLEN
ncbi:caspase domain protein [Francisella philomiragia]|uniref:caspase family protein n=1 Tax=Francisella philomiragia TaxID=28110 RepID=UPI0005A56321|nr:caspase family protein [Francisella philomiragia]AJI54401.1 caspase domain protein [Francisella philomiragia]MBK2252796.1 caspase family protein [Francisella philomiragia]